jgi:hypothetical protein
LASRRCDLREAFALEEERLGSRCREKKSTVKLVEKLAKGYSR